MAAEHLLRNPIGFLLVPRFTVIALSSAIEPLRIANRYVSKKYAWRLISADGKAVPDGNGLQIQPDRSIEDAGTLGTLFVCADHDPEKAATRRTVTWLRGLDRAGVTLGGIDAGAFVLARAGLLEHRRVTVHWEVIEAFRERYPGIEVTEALFEVDRDRLTSAGGIAVIDMMLHAIAADHGQAIADRVAEHCLHDHMRNASEIQRMAANPGTLQAQHPKVSQAIRYAEARLDRAFTPEDVAQAVGLSGRQLSRLFRAVLDESPARCFARMRLERSRLLLRRTAMPILDVAVACGFASQAHFSRSFREAFGHPPRDERRPEPPVPRLVMDLA
jgi:transcriptional regulator GlxA family with amidase domain